VSISDSAVLIVIMRESVTEVPINPIIRTRTHFFVTLISLHVAIYLSRKQTYENSVSDIKSAFYLLEFLGPIYNYPVAARISNQIHIHINVLYSLGILTKGGISLQLLENSVEELIADTEL
jgi:hypothetical protein